LVPPFRDQTRFTLAESGLVTRFSNSRFREQAHLFVVKFMEGKRLAELPRASPSKGRQTLRRTGRAVFRETSLFPTSKISHFSSEKTPMMLFPQGKENQRENSRRDNGLVTGGKFSGSADAPSSAAGQCGALTLPPGGHPPITNAVRGGIFCWGKKERRSGLDVFLEGQQLGG